MPAAIDNRQHRVPIRASRLARAVVRALTALGRPGGTVDVAIVDDAEIRRMNARYRGIGRRTDVLAFPLETTDAAGQLLGQIVVSADTARRQARRLGIPRQHLCDIERGRRNVSLERAVRFARTLGYSDRQFVTLALQDALRSAGLKMKVTVEAA